MFDKAYGVRQTEEATTAAIQDDLEAGRDLLAQTFSALQGTVQGLVGHNVSTDTVPKITAVLKPLTDAEMCKAMNCAFKWCAEYRP